MNTSDRIREFAVEKRVKPARERGQTKVAICVGCIHRRLRLDNRHRQVIKALTVEKFYQLAGVELVDRIGPPEGSTTVLVYKI